MGRKRSKKGSGRGSGRRSTSPRADRSGGATDARPRADNGGEGTSRLLLTRLIREGAIWEVHVSTRVQGAAANVTRLEFESAGGPRTKLRYTRPVEGALLEALHSGAPVSRASLEEELERALRQAATADPEAESGAPTDADDAPGTTGDRPVSHG